MLAMVRIPFTIVTDCNALVYELNKANLNPRIARWTLALQNYTFKVIHRPATHMSHVDALSRSVAYVNELPLEREIEFRQLNDPKIKEISNLLEFKDDEKFELINDWFIGKTAIIKNLYYQIRWLIAFYVHIMTIWLIVSSRKRFKE